MSPIPRARKTVGAQASLSGLGVHSGNQITVTLKPAESGQGLMLVRTDVGRSWPLSVAAVTPATNCTAIGDSEHSVMFVEHLMAALWAEGITDVVVEMDGSEVPLLDGSARPLLDLIRRAGCRDLKDPVEPLVVREPLHLGDETRFIAALPSERTEYAYLLHHPHQLIGLQFTSFRPAEDDFATELAPARTWGLAEELQQAQAAGLFKAGSEANALVVYDDYYSAPPTLPQEFARHKLVDLIGDLYLIGRPIVGTVFACRTGHTDNHQLAARLLGDE